MFLSEKKSVINPLYSDERSFPFTYDLSKPPPAHMHRHIIQLCIQSYNPASSDIPSRSGINVCPALFP